MNNISEPGNLPNLIIIGAMKSGTTSLHHYLNLHPEILMCRQKELDFFVAKKNWRHGVEWYKSHFVGQAKIYGETSPNYTRYPSWSGIPQRMFSVVPETKLIYLVRDPIERIISHYIHFYAESRVNCSIEELIANFAENRYVDQSRYFFQLEQYLQFFAAANILVLTSEKLLNSPQETMKQVFQFLGVETDFKFKFDVTKNAADVLKFGSSITNSDFKFDTKLHDSSYKRRIKIAADSPTAKVLATITKSLSMEIRDHVKKIIYLPFSEKIKRPKISESLRNRLLDYLAEDINRLKQFTGYSFEEWNLK